MTWNKIEKIFFQKWICYNDNEVKSRKHSFKNEFTTMTWNKIEKTFIQKWICFNDINFRENNEFVKTTTIFFLNFFSQFLFSIFFLNFFSQFFFSIFFILQSRFTFSLQTRLNRFNHKNNYNMHEHEKSLNLHINKIFEIEIFELLLQNI